MARQPAPRSLARLAAAREHGERSPLSRTAEVALQLVILGIAAYLLVQVLSMLYIVVIPFAVGTLFAALLRPAVLRLRRHGMGRISATWLTILVFWLLIAGVFFGVVQRATADIPALVDDTTATIQQLRDAAINGPFHVSPARIDDLSNQAIEFLQNHQETLTSGALSASVLIAEVVTGAILAFFIGFFLMYDGEGIFGWLVRFAPRQRRERLWRMGASAWSALSGYVRGTLIVAVFHGFVIGLTLTIMGVPLALPLAVLVAFGSLIPLIGAIVFGGVAVVVTLVTSGWLLAVILVGVLVAENQAEAHLLQPFVVGRYVHLHPLAIALALTAGTVFGGVWGALFAVPFTAAVWAAYAAVADSEAAVRAREPAGSAETTTEPADEAGESSQGRP